MQSLTSYIGQKNFYFHPSLDQHVKMLCLKVLQRRESPLGGIGRGRRGKGREFKTILQSLNTQIYLSVLQNWFIIISEMECHSFKTKIFDKDQLHISNDITAEYGTWTHLYSFYDTTTV